MFQYSFSKQTAYLYDCRFAVVGRDAKSRHRFPKPVPEAVSRQTGNDGKSYRVSISVVLGEKQTTISRFSTFKCEVNFRPLSTRDKFKFDLIRTERISTCKLRAAPHSCPNGKQGEQCGTVCHLEKTYVLVRKYYTGRFRLNCRSALSL